MPSQTTAPADRIISEATDVHEPTRPRPVRPILGLSVVFGVLFWLLDAALDAGAFNDAPFMDMLILGIPPSEIYMRSVVLLLFVGFGLAVSKLRSRGRAAEEQAASARALLDQKAGDLETTVRILHALDYPVVKIDSDNVIQFLNNAFLEYAEIDGLDTVQPDMLRPQCEGRSIAEFLSPGDVDRLAHAKSAAKDRRQARAARYRIGVNADFTYVSLQGTKTPIKASVTYSTILETYQLSFTDHSDQKQAESVLYKRFEFERLITNISTSFISVETGQIDEAIEDALAQIGRFAGVGRSYVFQFSTDGAVARNTHEWCADGVASRRASPEGTVQTKHLPWIARRIGGLEVIYVPRVADLPEEASREQRHFERWGIRSVVALPMIDRDSAIGFLGFDSTSEEKRWSDDDVSVLKIVGHILVTALGRNRSEDALTRSEETYRRLVGTLPDAVITADLNGCVTYASPQAAALYACECSQDLVGTDLVDLVAPTDRVLAAECIRSTFDDGSLKEAVCTHLRRDGTTFIGETNAAAIRDAAGRPASIIATTRDVTGRKQAEEALLRSETRHRRIIDAVTDYICTTYIEDGHPARTVHSHACEAVTGYSAEEFEADPHLWIRMVPEEDRAMVLEQSASVVGGHTPPPLEHRIRRKDGALRWISNTAVLSHDAAGILVSYDGLIRDITDHKRIQDAHQEESERAQRYLDGAGVVMVALDTDLNIEVFNQAGRRLLECDGERVIGLPWVEGFVSEDFRSEAGALLRDALAGQSDPQDVVEVPVCTRSGERRLLGWRTTAIVDGAGEVVGLLGSGEDITERKQAEASLLINEEKYHSLFDEMLNGFALHEIIVDADGNPCDYRFLDVNPAFEKLTGLCRADVLGKTVLEVLPGIETFWIERYGKVALEGESSHFEEFAGELDKFYEVTAYSPRRGEFATVFSDVTESKQLEAQLRQSQRLEAVGRLAGGIAHDFNNLLTVITAYTEIVEKNLAAGDPARAHVAEVARAADRAAQLTGRLLAFSRKAIINPQVMSMKRILTDVAPFLKRIISENVRLSVSAEDTVSNVKVDAVQIEQIILNMASNARDAMPGGGTLTLSAGNIDVDDALAEEMDCAPGPYVRLGVVDTGHGMDEETKDHIFEPFFSTKGDHGTGLGMATVYGIVKQHDGYIRCNSEPGAGTTFDVCFPAITAAPAEVTKVAEETSMRGTETVLVVEDEQGLLATSTLALKDQGYTVLPASTGEQALAIGRDHEGEIDAIFADVVLPDINGPEVAERIAKMYPGVKIVFTTGYSEDSIEYQGLLRPGTDSMKKPYHLGELLMRIRRELDGPPPDEPRPTGT